MKNISEFCTCKDLDCPLNPVNHDNAEKRASYSFEEFAQLVLKNKV